jgi:uncharacterized protein YqgQ
MEARLQFRQLLEKYGLIQLAGGEGDAIEWLESMAIQLADSIARRERFRQLLRQARQALDREQEKGQRQEKLSDGERKEKPSPYTETRFRRFNLTP